MNRRLNKLDKEILKLILRPNGGKPVCSKALATKLGVPSTTVQRRRKKLEEMGLLKTSYRVEPAFFGWHHVDFLLSTACGKTIRIVKKLGDLEQVTSITRTIGQPTIDLRVETVLRDNKEILDMLEILKGMDGVADAVWTERMERVVEKAFIPARLLESA